MFINQIDLNELLASTVAKKITLMKTVLDITLLRMDK